MAILCFTLVDGSWKSSFCVPFIICPQLVVQGTLEHQGDGRHLVRIHNTYFNLCYAVLAYSILFNSSLDSKLMCFLTWRNLLPRSDRSSCLYTKVTASRSRYIWFSWLWLSFCIRLYYFWLALIRVLRDQEFWKMLKKDLSASSPATAVLELECQIRVLTQVM